MVRFSEKKIRRKGWAFINDSFPSHGSKNVSLVRMVLMGIVFFTFGILQLQKGNELGIRLFFVLLLLSSLTFVSAIGIAKSKDHK